MCCWRSFGYQGQRMEKFHKNDLVTIRLQLIINALIVH